MGPKVSFLKVFSEFLAPLMQGVNMKSYMKKQTKYCIDLEPNLMPQLFTTLSQMES